MRPALRRAKGLAYLALLVASAVLIVAWWDELADVWRRHALTFLGASAVMGLAIVVQARNFMVLMDRPVDLRLRRMAGLWAATALLNYAGPLQPGVMARVLYLRTKGVEATASLLATWRQMLLSVICASLAIPLGLFLVSRPIPAWLAPVFLAGALVLIAAWRTAPRLIRRIERPAWLQQRKDLLVRAAGSVSIAGASGVVLQYVLGTVLLFWVYARFGAGIDLGTAILLACLVYVSSLLALVPGNFGVLEALYVAAGASLGMGVTDAAALAFLLRAAHVAACLAVALLGGGFSREPSA